MSIIQTQSQHTPDILDCLASLSNDEVFTPPRVVNDMLDMLPAEVFESTETTFLDPACKSGIFLREIAKRLLKAQIPEYETRTPVIEAVPEEMRSREDREYLKNLQTRIDHIFKNQLFAIAITDLTANLSRRSVYCSRKSNGKYSITKFENPIGNIRFENIKHTFKNGSCIFCGASKNVFGNEQRQNLEYHAYEFIHTNNPEKIFNMKFDVIIGNPPYQLQNGGKGTNASPIYHLFVDQAKKLNPNHLLMIIPSRWMVGGMGLGEFRLKMIHDKQISVLHDFVNSKDCFQGVDIKGGVCYFLWNRKTDQKCDIYTHNNGEILYSKRYLAEKNDDIYIRDFRMIGIKEKVEFLKEKLFLEIVSSVSPYGLATDIFKNTKKYGLPEMNNHPIPGGYEVLGLGEKQKREWKYISKNYPLPKKGCLNSYKIFMTKAYGVGALGEIPAPPVLAKPKQLCTFTFMEIGPFQTKKEMGNCYSYLKTKFFRLLVGICKQTQDATSRIYRFVPIQDFSENSEINWERSVPEIDAQLYKKYKLSKAEIAYIESVILPME